MTSTDFAGQDGRADGGGQGGAGGGASPGEATAKDASPKEMARQAVQAVRSEAASFADSAKGLASERMERGRQSAGKTMDDFASAIRKAGDELAGRQQDMAGQVVKKAADGLQNVSRSITDKRPDQMLDAVRDFARQNPAAFIAGSVLAGIAIGRFAKSSQAREAGRSAEPSNIARQDEPAAQHAPAYPMSNDTSPAAEI